MLAVCQNVIPKRPLGGGEDHRVGRRTVPSFARVSVPTWLSGARSRSTALSRSSVQNRPAWSKPHSALRSGASFCCRSGRTASRISGGFGYAAFVASEPVPSHDRVCFDICLCARTAIRFGAHGHWCSVCHSVIIPVSRFRVGSDIPRFICLLDVSPHRRLGAWSRPRYQADEPIDSGFSHKTSLPVSDWCVECRH